MRRLHFDLLQRIDADHSVLLFSDVYFLFLRDDSVEHGGRRAAVKEVNEFFVVNLNERTLHDEFRLGLSRFDLVENELVDTGNDALVLWTDPNCVPAAHSVSLP